MRPITVSLLIIFESFGLAVVVEVVAVMFHFGKSNILNATFFGATEGFEIGEHCTETMKHNIPKMKILEIYIEEKLRECNAMTIDKRIKKIKSESYFSSQNGRTELKKLLKAYKTIWK